MERGLQQTQMVSIHAPNEGSDQGETPPDSPLTGFNPRSQ